MTKTYLHNTLSRSKQEFVPLNEHNVGMYVCGPTVYARPHIGNARSVVIYDVLFRLLRAVYGDEHVKYVRNITDVDDKINVAAKEREISIQELTSEVTEQFHADMESLGVLRPTIEPKATEHIAEIIQMIEQLIAGGYAYVAEGHVLFEVANNNQQPITNNQYYYGKLSNRSIEDMIAGSRVEVAAYKRHAGDFVLWKPSLEIDDESSKFASPWGVGRPGWHIECSAMSTKHLGKNFDIHGGGADLMFPHHENEIAQSCSANHGSHYAKYWVHNGFLTVDGEKMSKSLGNFITVHELLEHGVQGEVIRFALMSTHYRKPLDWTDKLISDAKKQLDGFYRGVESTKQVDEVSDEFMQVLADDLNMPEAVAMLHSAPKENLQAMGALLGILQTNPKSWFKGDVATGDDAEIEKLITARKQAKTDKNWGQADEIRAKLTDMNIVLEDKPDGTTNWRRG